MTEQRRLITEIIQTTDGHMSAEEIHLAARAQMPCIAIGTVYRNLGLMEQAGEIRRIPVPDAPDRYDRNTHLHDHLFCRSCGKLHDICLSDLLGLMNGMTEMQIDSYELALYGICKHCQTSGAAAESQYSAANTNSL